MKTRAEYLNLKTENELKIEGYYLSRVKQILTWILIVLSFGFLKLIFYWRNDLMLKFTHKRCDLKNATKVLLTDKYNQKFVEIIQYLEQPRFISRINDESKEDSKMLLSPNKTFYFTNKKIKYFWNHKNEAFEKLKGLEDDYTFEYFQKQNGLTEDDQAAKRLIYGENSIGVSITPLLKLFIREILSPFYIFQIFSCALWFFEKYIYFATCIVIISTVSIVYSLHSIRRNERALRNMIHNVNQVNILRKKTFKNNNFVYEEVTTSSNYLVPGDIIEIKNMSIMQCDALLLEDSTVVVNESMLTGESVPITKTGIGFSDKTDSKLDIKEHKKHILFSGTQVIQTRLLSSQKVKAIVLRTGFDTSKGELIRAILYPRPSEFRFDLDIYKYIGALTLIAVLGMIYTIAIMLIRKNPLSEIILRSLDLITIVVPPALPGALTACLIYAQNRLRKNKIYCISPNRINVCGSIDVFVFDKTGTLTEDDCDIKCILSTSQNQNDKIIFSTEIKSAKDLSENLVELLASCHSITKLNNALAGDPLDLKLFEFTKWIYSENNDNESPHPIEVYPAFDLKKKLGIVKQFPFSSALQRMGVIVKSSNRSSFDFFSKGSPEMIASQCETSTLPVNFNSVLNEYSSKGYRIIALACKTLFNSNINEIERSELETNMRFLGLVVMENKLKKETTRVINQLNMADIRSIMCTGDNILTALSVALECGIISSQAKIINIESDDHGNITYKQENLNAYDMFTHDKNSKTSFIINGSSFEIIRQNYPEIFDDLIEKGAIFARMSPEQKQQLIEALQSRGYFVGMCGDGANDCGALKAANAGVSLSEAEASIASPFTSKNPNIECTIALIREGRCALVTSFGLVKFICMYSLTNFISVILLYSIGYLLSDSEFLYIDMGLVTFIAFFFSQTEAFPVLDIIPPTNKLIAWKPICSLAFHTLLTFFIQFFAFYHVQIQPWYEKFCEDIYIKGYLGPYENSSVFIVSLFQYITAGVIFSKGIPYRKNIFTNKFLTVFLALATLLNLFLGLNSFKFVTNVIVMRFLPDLKFKLIIIGLAVVHFFISFMFENFLFDEVYALL